MIEKDRKNTELVKTKNSTQFESPSREKITGAYQRRVAAARVRVTNILVKLNDNDCAAILDTAPGGIEKLVHFTFLAPGNVHFTVDCFFNPGIGSGIESAGFPVDPVIESKTGIRYEIPRKFKPATDLIRGFAAAVVRDVLGKRYHPRSLPDLETTITYSGLAIVIVMPSKVTARLGKTGAKVAASSRKRRPS